MDACVASYARRNKKKQKHKSTAWAQLMPLKWMRNVDRSEWICGWVSANKVQYVINQIHQQTIFQRGIIDNNLWKICELKLQSFTTLDLSENRKKKLGDTSENQNTFRKKLFTRPMAGHTTKPHSGSYCINKLHTGFIWGAWRDSTRH